jgi:hypothetical protein
VLEAVAVDEEVAEDELVAVVVAVAVAVAVAVFVRQLERSPPPPNVPSGHGVHSNDPAELYSFSAQLKQPGSPSTGAAS